MKNHAIATAIALLLASCSYNYDVFNPSSQADGGSSQNDGTSVGPDGTSSPESGGTETGADATSLSDGSTPDASQGYRLRRGGCGRCSRRRDGAGELAAAVHGALPGRYGLHQQPPVRLRELQRYLPASGVRAYLRGRHALRDERQLWFQGVHSGCVHAAFVHALLRGRQPVRQQRRLRLEGLYCGRLPAARLLSQLPAQRPVRQQRRLHVAHVPERSLPVDWRSPPYRDGCSSCQSAKNMMMSRTQSNAMRTRRLRITVGAP